MMHIQKCEHPHRIYNKYIQEFQYVPCGRCPSCLKSRALRWIERLNVERKCWKYCLFYTLTYSNENLPTLHYTNGTLIDLFHLHTAPGSPSPCVDVLSYNFSSNEERNQTISHCRKYQDIPFLSVYDSQCFIKRLRKNLKDYIKNSYKEYDEKDYQVRYYHIGEYGSTTYRPHYHGLLFFSSEKEAACIDQIIRKSWKLGICDTSFVSQSNAGYLAQYLNCLSGLPKIYEHKNLRPFAIFSKTPPIGTLYFDDSQIREIFDNASPTMFADYLTGLSPRNVPLWRTYQDRLFPKLPLFSRFSHYDRIKLYRASVWFEENSLRQYSAADFAGHMYACYQMSKDIGFSSYYLHIYDDYIRALQSNTDDLYSSLRRWFYLSNTVCRQAVVFGISIEDYVSQIEKFYDNCDLEKLRLQYDFMSDYANKYGTGSLVGFDRLFIESMLDVPKYLMSFEEITQLQSFGIDIDKFTSDDDSVRLPYQSELLPEHTRDFWNIVIDNGVWLKKKTKTKIKNDYLSSHPELKERLDSFHSLTNF